MGWLFSPRWTNRAELLAHLRRPERYAPNYELLRSQAVGNNHWYLVHNKAHDKIFIGLDLMAGSGRQCQSHGWGYKDMDESAGPYQLNCPLGYLDQASEPTGYAIEWREKVREYHAKRTARLSPATGLFATYNKVTYRLSSCAGRNKGWYADRVSDSALFRLKAKQIANSVISKELS